MKIQNLLLLTAIAMANPLYATGLTDVIEKQPLAERLLKGEEATVIWPEMSSSTSGLPDFQMVPTGIKIESTNKNKSSATFSTNGSAKGTGQETGQLVADKTGDPPVRLEISATKQTFGFTSTLQHVHVFVEALLVETPGEPADKEAILYYKRPDGIYDGWGLHLFNNENCEAFGQADTDWNTGPNQVPGLIVQRISDEAPYENIDPAYEVIIIAINPSGEAINFPVSEN
nr:hypothetical protein [Endozoicomonas sp.]